MFDNGVALRSITHTDGRTAQTGTPLPEEAGIPLDSFYLDELDTVWQRFGLSSFLSSEPAGPVTALHVIDRTPYPEPVQTARQRSTTSTRRAWWKFW